MTRIFFSWQSDVAQRATTRTIRTAIASAAAQLTAKHGGQFVSDEATRDVAGAPYIPGTIALKIQACEIFVCDITTIATSSDGKSIPNPNVSFELGLAVAQLGWDRCILIFNEGVASFDKLPFDFDRHRISRYKMDDSSTAVKAGQKQLNQLLSLAIDTIFEKNPPKPRDLEGKTEQQIKHDRDVANLKWFFRNLSVDLLGKHTTEMPDMLYYFAPVMHDALNGILHSQSFRLYDTKLEKKLYALVSHLGKTLAHDGHYRELNNSWVQAFGRRDRFTDRQAELVAGEAIRKASRSLARTLSGVIETIRNNYIEVDLDDLGSRFTKEYNNMIRDTDTE